ncbi:MAG: hypothetical protein ACHQ50_03675 [Fimbriimonadales bacterium]
MSEKKTFTPEVALDSATKFDWVELGRGEQHVLFRTAVGEWIILPTGDASYGPWLQQRFVRAAHRQIDAGLAEVKGYVSLAKRIRTIGAILVAMGIVLAIGTSIELIWSPSQNSASEPALFGVILVLALPLMILAPWVGRRFVGPWLFRDRRPPDRPFGH